MHRGRTGTFGRSVDPAAAPEPALAWSQVVALVALTVVCFGLGYVAFVRQEIRA